ncbi:MAG: DUF4843 domain-containing protein [Duncaniella sp.]|nr:DUF4843 domain-containing protein [Duncaniella sp.]
MKFKYIVLAAALTGVSMVSCDKEEVDRYDTSRAALNIGFTSAAQLAQTSIWNYSETTTERPLKFFARVSGMPADVDRQFRLAATDGNLDLVGSSVRFDTYTIPAGEVAGEFEIYFDPAGLANPAAFATEEGELVITLIPDETFLVGAQGQNELRITLRNFLAKPEKWDVGGGFYEPSIASIFGVYSTEKLQFMIEQGTPANFKIFTNQTENGVPDPDKAGAYIISTGYANFLKQKCIVALEKYNATHSTPLRDSFGNPIYF